MKKVTLLFILLISYSAYAQYITPGTGVTWNLDSLVVRSSGVLTGVFPNYTINGIVTVSATDKVFVVAGSIITASANAAGFEVNGAFSALGDSLNNILFTSAPSSTGAGWQGFRFNIGIIDSLCLIRWARIEYAAYGLRCVNANPRLTRSHLYMCGRGIQLSAASPIILSNKIEKSYEYGITLTLASSPMIINNEIFNNNMQNTSPKTQITVGTQGINSPVIMYNKIYGSTNNRTGGIAISSLFSGSASSSEISFNEIYNNSYGIALAGGTVTCNIHHNYIHNNTINTDPLTTGSGINVNGTAPNAPTIHHNVISGNYWGVTIQNGTTIQAGPQPNLGNIVNTDSTDNGFNTIVGNKQGAVFYELFNNCTNDIYAQNNYWGVSDSASIEQRITHKVDTLIRGWVYFLPFIDSTQIPVELTQFNAAKSGKSIVLVWRTATEKNNQGFEIESATSNGSLNELLVWKKLGFISGNGTTLQPNYYTFEDKDNAAGKHLYRLHQIDYDGTRKLVSEASIEIEAMASAYSLWQNYPNPFNPSTVIKYSVGGDKSVNVTLTVFNSLGEEIARLVDGMKAPGNYSAEFNTSSSNLKNLSSGVYYYSLKCGSFSETKKFVLMK